MPRSKPGLCALVVPVLMLDDLIPLIEQARHEGAIVLLKWDGARRQLPCTVAITRTDTDYMWRQDTEHLVQTLTQALAEYRVAHPLSSPSLPNAV